MHFTFVIFLEAHGTHFTTKVQNNLSTLPSTNRGLVLVKETITY